MGQQSHSAGVRIRQAALTGVAVLAGATICVASLSAASRDPAPRTSQEPLQLAKSGSYDPTAEEFRQDLGVPVEDAGGGWHAVLTQDAADLGTVLAAGGFSDNGVSVDYEHKQAIGYVVGRFPDAAALARYSQQAESHGFSTRLVSVYRSVADAELQHSRIDRTALAAKGIEIGVTGVDITTGLVRVDVYDGTQAKADFISKTYGPEGLQINIGDVPHPQEAPMHVDFPPEPR